MKATLAILFLAALGGPIAATNTGIAPTHALVWNDFGAVLAVDGVAIMGGHDGVMTARFDKPQLQFTPLSYSYVSGPIKRLKQTDSLVVAQSAAGSLYFYRRAALPELILLGTVTPQVEYEDFALMGTSLFLARGFEGVTQYRVESYGKLTPVDSTVEPVHAIALETSADRLLVVDDYTGIFGYNPSPVSMGSPVIELNLTSPAGVMAIRDNVAFISLKSSAILKATVWPDSLVVTDTFPAYFSHSRLEVVDTFLVGTSSDGSGFDVVSLSHRQNLIFVDSGWDAFGAAVFSAGDSNYLTIP
ncbi:MAG: hypothetical protein HY851_00885, partial [candidate division Zixibacteria bacterium]|nr:hypothetical protein [candidate division Zixibacteria bacterium]